MTKSQLSEANEIIQSSLSFAGGIILIPFAALDLVALVIIQLRMLRKLTALYELPFEEQRARAIVSTLIASTTPLVAAQGLRWVPVLGVPLSWLGGAAMGAASTYALGKIFVQHLESGGTLFTLDPERVEAHYQQKFEQYMQFDGDELAADFSDVKP